jgi:hypothetical protein
LLLLLSSDRRDAANTYDGKRKENQNVSLLWGTFLACAREKNIRSCLSLEFFMMVNAKEAREPIQEVHSDVFKQARFREKSFCGILLLLVKVIVENM